jgi:uncharacterized protein YukE
MTLPYSVDDASINSLRSAMETAQAACTSASNAVNGVSSSMQWTGDASARYRGSLASWMEGLTTVQNGLNALAESMSSAQQYSTNTEDTSTQNANWYR